MILLAAALAATPTDCHRDDAKMLALPFDQFDQDLTGGWRAINNEGCTAAVAELLHRYRNEHQPLTEAQRALLNWHEGQLRAFAGEYQRAIPLLMRGVNDEKETDRAFREYALGTVAFLERDRGALVSARDRLAALPRPHDWSDTQTAMIDGKPISFTISWPLNLSVLDGLIKCFDRPYKVAYGCRS